MIHQCQNCGAQVRIVKSGSAGLVRGIGMMLVLGVSALVIYRTVYMPMGKDASLASGRIGQMGESR
jgi:hypothetical protein